MKAWLITWEWDSPSASVVDKVAGILEPRLASKTVSRIIEFLYARTTSNITELSTYAKNRSYGYYSAIPFIANGIKQGDRIICGTHPYLYGRIVSELQVTSDVDRFEIISWCEQDTYRLNKTECKIEKDTGGNYESFKRYVEGKICDDIMWDRVSGDYKNEIITKLRANKTQ